ncbi:MAG TPA: hypothetical protein PLN63_05830 [Paludibacteraceae bacterium]|nr:hypothetical protein [Paludibacteraceae bacterium]HPH63120.1 hypothetical protein [Paludibacteraceae bacterium]
MKKAIIYKIVVLFSLAAAWFISNRLVNGQTRGVWLFVVAFILILIGCFLLVKAVLFLRSKIGMLNALFVAIFFSSLLIPVMQISKEKMSEKENRMLANYPQVQTSDDLYTYGNNFDLWFNDHFLGRDQLLSMHDGVLNFVRGEENQSDFFTRALIGEDGWLFYKGNNLMESYANTLTVEENNMSAVLTYLQKVDNWCKANGMKFYFVVCPDKNRVYGEYLSFINKVNPDSMSRINQILRAMKEKTSVKSLYLLNRLLQEKNNGLLYYKNDTHWSLLGSYYGSLALMEMMANDMNFKPVECDSFETYINANGDLSSMILNAKEDSVTKYKMPIFKEPMGVKVETGLCRRLDNPSRQGKVFLVGDSYSYKMIDVLSYSFSLVERKTERDDEFVWQLTQEDLDFIKSQKVDALIMEIVERNIDKMYTCKFPMMK